MDLLRCTLKPLCVLLAELMGVMGEWLSVIGTLALILLMKFRFVLAWRKQTAAVMAARLIHELN
jgi:hypothetical protein